MKIGQNTIATLAYTLTSDNNRTIVEIIRKNHPKSFLFGQRILLEGFENNLMDMEAGSNFDFVLQPKDAYGTKDPFAVLDIPKDTFMVDGKVDEKVLIIGNQIPMRDNYGNTHMGVVLDVEKDNIVIDFNHPLAGKEIRFQGEVISIREATQDELDSLNKGGCGSGCGCGGGDSEAKAKNHTCDPEREAAGECCHGDESKCGCKSDAEASANEENCVICGNAPEDQGKGIGNCRCI